MRIITTATTALAIVVMSCGGEVGSSTLSTTVALVEAVRAGSTITHDGRSTQVSGQERAVQGATVATEAGGRSRVRLDSGAWALLDENTEVTVDLSEMNLGRGRIWVDTSSAEETSIETTSGTLTASGAAFSVTHTDGGAEVYCGSGELSFRTSDGTGRLQQGESVTLSSSGSPEPQPVALWDDWTGGLADPTSMITREPESVGTLAGRPIAQIGHARVPIPVRAHDVQVSIRGDLAVTEVVQTFFNARSEILENEYTIRLPREAIVTGFAISFGRDDFVEASIGPLAMTDGRVDWSPAPTVPNALTYDGPNRLRARVYPLAPGATVRVRLRYAEWLDRQGDRRTFVYPMGTQGEAPLLGEFTFTADLNEAGASAIRAGMGAQVSSNQVVLRRSDFRPRSDLYLDLIGGGSTSGRAAAYIVDAPPADEGGGEERYVLFDIPTPEGEAEETQAPLELVLLVDTSGGMAEEHLELARSVVEATLQQLGPRDRVALLLADVSGHAPEGFRDELQDMSPATRESILDAMARVGLGGASDLARSLSDAAVLVAGRPRGAVLYIGDGVPTTGPMDATAIKASLSTLESPPRFFGLAVGEGANLGLLRALFGDARAQEVEERTEASLEVMEILAEASRPTLRGVQAELGPTVERIYPSSLITVPVGSNVRLVGRLAGELPETLVLRGERNGQPFEETLDVEGRELDDGGYVRRRWASERLAELLDGGARQEILVNLGARFDIITPWTALVVGGGRGLPYHPLRGFDRPPLQVAWSIGGGSPSMAAMNTLQGNPIAIESTWTERTSAANEPTAGGAGRTRPDGGIAQASVRRALVEGERAPRQCYERRLLARPELSGQVTVRVDVDGGGVVHNVTVTTSTLQDPQVERCLLTEVQGLRFPSTGGGGRITADHRFTFAIPERELGGPRQCSPAARLPLRIRRDLWAERLRQDQGVDWALHVYREAKSKCELGSWNARRTLLGMMLRDVGDLVERIALYQAFGPGSTDAAYLKQEILRTVQTPQQLATVFTGLGLRVSVDWGVFTRDWNDASTAEERLSLVRRWLEAVPFDIDLRLRQVQLLEETGARAEARRAARDLADDPLCDAAARATLAEFWMRQDDLVEARRALSEIVERSPLDPWAHRRVGDLYLAFGWGDGAYREYMTLARFRPADPEVTLLLARAAAASERTDEALRLEQRLSESVAPGANEGIASLARLWTAVRLARLKSRAETPELRAAVSRRERSSGALRERPVLFAALTWDHPDRRPELHVRYPSDSDITQYERAPLRGDRFGIEALRVHDHDPGVYHFEVRRPESHDDIDAKLIVVVMPGTTDEQIQELDVTLEGDVRAARFRLTETGELEVVQIEG